MAQALLGDPAAIMETHECNGYCRGTIHADVFWCCDATPEDNIKELRYLCEVWGLTFVEAQPAHEAVLPPGAAMLHFNEQGQVIEVPLPATDKPWLLLFRVEETPDA